MSEGMPCEKQVAAALSHIAAKNAVLNRVRTWAEETATKPITMLGPPAYEPEVRRAVAKEILILLEAPNAE